MGWELEVLKAAITTYIQYQNENATDESLRRLASKLDEISRLIEKNYNGIIQTIMEIKRDELKGRLIGHIDQFRLLHNLPEASRIIFQDNSSKLTGELTALADSRTYRPEYLYDFLRMLVILAPIHAFANRCIKVPEVRYIFERAYSTCNPYLRTPRDVSSDPGFQANDADEAGNQFRLWLDNNFHPFTKMLIEGHWVMRRSGRFYYRWYPSVNGSRVPDDIYPNTGEAIQEILGTLMHKDKFIIVSTMRAEMKNALEASPRLDTEANVNLEDEKLLELPKNTSRLFKTPQKETLNPEQPVSLLRAKL